MAGNKSRYSSIHNVLTRVDELLLSSRKVNEEDKKVTEDKKIQILCPEYVPLENKGEEAIIRGVVDVLNLDEGCTYHIVDNNSPKYYFSLELRQAVPGSVGAITVRRSMFADLRSLCTTTDEVHDRI